MRTCIKNGRNREGNEEEADDAKKYKKKIRSKKATNKCIRKMKREERRKKNFQPFAMDATWHHQCMRITSKRIDKCEGMSYSFFFSLRIQLVGISKILPGHISKKEVYASHLAIPKRSFFALFFNSRLVS